MFNNKELTKIMSMVVNESVKLQKEIEECDSKLEKESLERDLVSVNAIGAKISKVINAIPEQEYDICCPNCGSSNLSEISDRETPLVFICEDCEYEFPKSEVEL